MNAVDLNRFVLGALLHDIGKFKQRAGYPEDKGKTHSLIGYEWLRTHYGDGLISAAARNHHASELETWKSNLSLIIYEADNLAASERKEFDPERDVDQKWHREVLLACDFSRISLPKWGGKESSLKYWPLSPLGGWTEPQETSDGATAEVYGELWEAFVEEFEAVKAAGNHLNERVMLHLLEKYTSTIPSITLQIRAADEKESFRKHPDVSLFDHSKVTAAAAASLYHFIRSRFPERWDEEILKDEITEDWASETNQPFLLIGGDLSGVQRFIYTISSKGALKSLKGRSFFLELLTEYVVERILEELGLPRSSVIFTGGGHFYILGPNTLKAQDSIVSIGRETNLYLFNEFNAELLLLIEWVPMDKAGFKDASNAWAALAERLETRKMRKWEEELDQLFSPPAMPHDDCLTQRCEVCGREDKPLSGDELKMCPTCGEQFAFGEALQKVFRRMDPQKGRHGAIAVWNREPEDGDAKRCLSIGTDSHKRYYQPVLFEEVKTHLTRETPIFYWLNEWDLKLFVGKGDRPALAGLYHPSRFEDLEGLVQQGFGLNRAAVLRLDIDNLGVLFREGLPDGDRTFSRMASISRQLSLFFKFHINGILDRTAKRGYECLPRTDVALRFNGEGNKERLLSVVYAGGDDLFLIGHWLDVLESAFDIYYAFSRFTGNPSITLSGGYALGAPHHPVYRFALDAGTAEEEAKKNENKDSLCFFRKPLRWKEAMEVRDFLQEGIRYLLQDGGGFLQVPPGSVSRGFFYRLLALIRAVDKEEAWFLPKVAYLMGRNAPKVNWLRTNPKAAKAWSDLKARTFMIPKEDHIRKMEAATLWTLMMMRKGGSE